MNSTVAYGTPPTHLSAHADPDEHDNAFAPSLVALGNALVDTEYTVSDAVITELGLALGNMTLADSQTQAMLFDTLRAHGLKPSKQAGGGSAANSVAAFAALGGRPFYNCQVANDVRGQFYLQDLADFGVITNATKAFAQVSSDDVDDVTGSCVVLVTPDGERTMQTHLGVSALFDDANVDFCQITKSDWLYIEGYLAMTPSILPAIAKLRQQAGLNDVGIVVSFADPAVIKFAKEGLLQIIGNGVKVIFCNLEEAQLFTGKKQHRTCVKALLDHCEMAVVTNGKEPVIIGERTHDADEPRFTEVPSLDAQVLDTNGAGDNFAGAFLYGLSQSYDVETCARLASHVAAKVVEQFGARLAKNDYHALKEQVLN